MDHRIPCIVRVPASEEIPIKKTLDIGAAGIIAPQTNTEEQVESVVRYCRYSPQGSRGVGLSRATTYGLGLTDYVGSANDTVAVIVQAEHIDAVENIEAIVKVEGVDAIFIGPYDLSASMGKMGQVTDPAVVDRDRSRDQSLQRHRDAAGHLWCHCRISNSIEFRSRCGRLDDGSRCERHVVSFTFNGSFLR